MISVIIPVYNVEKYLVPCVQSVLSQTFCQIQVVLVDDCSSDRSLEICERFAEQDQRVTVLHHDGNRGVSAARNSGMTVAEGEYIFFADSDDVLDSDCLEFLLHLIQSNEAYDLAACGYYINQDEVADSRTMPQIFEGAAAAAEIAGKNAGTMKGYLWNKLFKRDLLKNNHILFREDLAACEDALFCQEYAGHCRKIVYDAQPKYHYIQHGSSAVHSKINARRMTLFTAYQNIIEICSRYGDQDLERCLYANYWSHCIVFIKRIVLNYSKDQKQYAQRCFDILRGHGFEILRNPYISVKRKLLYLAVLPLSFF